MSSHSQMTRKAEKRLGVLRARAEVLKARMASNSGKPAAKDAEQELLALEWAFDRIEQSYGPSERVRLQYEWLAPKLSTEERKSLDVIYAAASSATDRREAMRKEVIGNATLYLGAL